MKQREFESLVGPFLPALYRLAFRFTGNEHDADDLLQTVLLKLYPRLKELKRVDSLKPWLAKVLYREFIDSNRREQRRLKVVEFSDPHDEVDSPEAMETRAAAPDILYFRGERWQQIQAAMDTLNVDQKTLISMHDIEGYTTEELVEILDVPSGTIKSRLHRARARLRELLDREPDQQPQRVQERGMKK